MIASIEAPEERVVRICTHAEQKVLRVLSREVDPDRDSLVVATQIASRAEFSHASVGSCLRVLEAAGLLATQSLGTKGIMIRVLDTRAWQALVQRLAA